MWNGVVYGADAVVGGDMEVLTEGWVQGVEVDCEVSVCRVFKLSLSEMKVIEAHYEAVEAGDGNTESGEGDSDVGKTDPPRGLAEDFRRDLRTVTWPDPHTKGRLTQDAFRKQKYSVKVQCGIQLNQIRYRFHSRCLQY